MTQAIAVRRDGDAFQARVFWRKAACLLDPLSPVVRVGFESGPKGFDDVWVEYHGDRAPGDQEGHPILREHIQCKWHVSMSDFGYADLVNPEWINANNVSLLQRARAAQLEHAPIGVGVRFKLLTNWRIGQTDPLRPYIHQKSKTLRLKGLFDGSTDRSAAGKIRKLWREHLGIEEQELIHLVRTLSLDTDSSSLDDHRDNLDLLFENRGLRRIPSNESSFIYDDIVFQWLSQGRLAFDRKSFHEACKREGLLAGAVQVPKVFGVKSFEHPFDRLEDRCEIVLDLISHFDDRAIRAQSEWTDILYPRLRSFLQTAAKDHQQLRLVLDAHITLAFAAGSVLDIKSGRQVEIEQRTINRRVWHASDMPRDSSWCDWTFETLTINEAGQEMAVAVCLTHDVAAEVKTHLVSQAPNVGTLLIARPNGGSSTKSVVCGQHAFELAESLAAHVKSMRTNLRPGCHVFIAAPNAFTFFLGQRRPSLGAVTLYEYDFEGMRSGGYEASLTLPI
ncbi:SAVED domain-containing protein [Burkholderia sp. Ax-1719]|uniref:SAVED domain-containing protein n=1 Tax=Burkholderia sp. Ax-1719 TaxID=2608334 RepID=UPI00141DDCDE|nr:SAVED domain-containing protein [Burkholderia sp. Ax-1719]NIE63151.1 SAVED domain-containing protein [Burkholderia sp. Ax-1719]